MAKEGGVEMAKKDRKATRDIDLYFFTYKAYYDEDGEYVVHWKIDYFYLMALCFLVGSMYFTYLHK